MFRDLIRKEREREDKIAQLQRLITEGIESGYSEKTVSQIWAEARKKYETQNG